ncbi:DUF1349 domain-containing protein [Chitinophaga deserti]|uniref:DUF1349 domain-containing protein n=1 Tax=Chitinophaga deserti TaxID=2164099 RepID=UPI000D6A868F|nr:DUF1349 domain-containing protein [Chitinophaga deserti]
MLKSLFPFLCTIISLPAFAAHPETFAFEDSIRLKVLPRALTVDPSKGSLKATADNGFVLHANRNTDLYTFVDSSFYVHQVPMATFLADEQFIFSARVRPDCKALYDGGALILYTDSSNWAKLLIEKMDDGRIMLGSSLVTGRVTDDSYHRAVNAPEVYVKAARSGNIYGFYFSEDGKKWQLLRTFRYRNPAGLRIGFYAQSPKGEGMELQVSDVKYRPEAFKNFHAGE